MCAHVSTIMMRAPQSDSCSIAPLIARLIQALHHQPLEAAHQLAPQLAQSASLVQTAQTLKEHGCALAHCSSCLARLPNETATSTLLQTMAASASLVKRLTAALTMCLPRSSTWTMMTLPRAVKTAAVAAAVVMLMLRLAARPTTAAAPKAKQPAATEAVAVGGELVGVGVLRRPTAAAAELLRERSNCPANARAISTCHS